VTVLMRGRPRMGPIIKRRGGKRGNERLKKKKRQEQKSTTFSHIHRYESRRMGTKTGHTKQTPTPKSHQADNREERKGSPIDRKKGLLEKNTQMNANDSKKNKKRWVPHLSYDTKSKRDKQPVVGGGGIKGEGFNHIKEKRGKAESCWEVLSRVRRRSVVRTMSRIMHVGG